MPRGVSNGQVLHQAGAGVVSVDDECEDDDDCACVEDDGAGDAQECVHVGGHVATREAMNEVCWAHWHSLAESLRIQQGQTFD